MTGTTPSTDANDHFHHTPEPTVLAQALNKGVSKAEPYTTQILIAVVAVIAIASAALFWMRSAGAEQAAGWDEFALCRAPDDYLALAEKYPKLPVGQWSRLNAARQFLSEGLGQALTNRSASDERVKQAKDAFEVLLTPDVPGQLREEALYGLATAHEALSNGDDSPAIKAYEQLLQDFPESQHRLWAKERVKVLKTKDAEGFYAWFRTQNPKPADRPKPLDIPSNPPEDVFNDLQLPKGAAPAGDKPAAPTGEMKLELPKPEGETAKPVPEATEKGNMPAETKAPAPVPSEAAPKVESPAAEKPAAEVPATPEAKPAEEPAK